MHAAVAESPDFPALRKVSRDCNAVGPGISDVGNANAFPRCGATAESGVRYCRFRFRAPRRSAQRDHARAIVRVVLRRDIGRKLDRTQVLYVNKAARAGDVAALELNSATV